MPYKTRKVGNKYCVYKKDGGKKVGCTKGTQEAKKKYLAALHIAEDEEYEAEKYYAKFSGRVVGPYDTEKEAYYDTKGDAEWIKKGVELNVKMESFKFFFESKDADIEDLIKMIKNPDPSKVKEYGGTEYVDMLRKKLARLRADIEYLNPEEIQKFAYNLGYEDIESSDMPNYFDYEGKRYYIKDEGDNWEIWANAWNEGEKDSRADDYSNRADYYRELEIYGEDEQSKIRKGGAGKAFYTGTRVEKDKKKEKSKKRARGKVRDEDAQDRCKRKADQVYGKKTSAYKSGAIVRCRKGKIWKKK
tara:strand:+ start:373 stop:1281 length:909 start_codon:yes stop_codon:yes gene_type:complete